MDELFDWAHTQVGRSIVVQCVYGRQHLCHMENVLLPLLSRSTKRQVTLAVVNYDGGSPVEMKSGGSDGVQIRSFPCPRPHAIGFAQAHNYLFSKLAPNDAFVLLNPDCIPQPGSIDRLLHRSAICKSTPAIVEGRQWPFEHPKDYDVLTLETSWASGAFCLVDAGFYSSVGGMDELFGLYLEDVDLSWRAWLSGYDVLHEPAAAVIHFSGGRFYRKDLVSHESFYSLRNHLLLSRKFFGDEGEAEARALLCHHPDRELAKLALQSYEAISPSAIDLRLVGRRHTKIQILGLGRYHEMRSP